MKLVPLAGAAAAWWLGSDPANRIASALVPPAPPTPVVDEYAQVGPAQMAFAASIDQHNLVSLGIRAGLAYLAYRALA